MPGDLPVHPHLSSFSKWLTKRSSPFSSTCFRWGANSSRLDRCRWSKDGQDQSRDLQKLVEATAKLTLRLADAQQVSSSGLWLYMVRQHGARRNTSHDVRSELGVEKAAGDQPASDHKPLPTLMMSCILEELVARMRKTVAEEAMQRSALQAGWCTEAGTWLYKHWGPVKKDLVEAKTTPLALSDLETIVKEIQTRPPPEPPEAVRQHGPEAEEPLASGEATQTRPRQTPGWTSASSALCLKLRNAGNTCYINTLVHIISWLLERTASQVTCLGLGQHAWRAVLVQRKAFVVRNLFPWTFLMQGWSHGGRQRDICEFFSRLVCRMQPTPFQGTWNARFLEAGRICVHDSGDCTNLLTLDVPTSGHWQLQDLVNSWRGQAFVHALESTPWNAWDMAEQGRCTPCYVWQGSTMERKQNGDHIAIWWRPQSSRGKSAWTLGRKPSLYTSASKSVLSWSRTG